MRLSNERLNLLEPWPNGADSYLAGAASVRVFVRIEKAGPWPGALGWLGNCGVRAGMMAPAISPTRRGPGIPTEIYSGTKHRSPFFGGLAGSVAFNWRRPLGSYCVGASDALRAQLAAKRRSAALILLAIERTLAGGCAVQR